MEFRHLPVAGGIYDQHPEFIEAMMRLLSERGIHEREKQKARDNENKQGTRMPSHPRRKR
jgi:hypothetical protein